MRLSVFGFLVAVSASLSMFTIGFRALADGTPSPAAFFCESPLPSASPDASSVDSKPNLAQLAVNAVSENSDIAQKAIERLRQAGPSGLDALFTAHQAMIDQHAMEETTHRADPQWHRLMMALDAVGGQHDCHSSHLFWYTDFEAAKTAARQAGKPILSLRLLGKLSDEFSCANSRFFRSTLYANAEISNVLHDHFILHWQSVRPVPKVTIDFGDGRKLERTLTGNSIHYILDSDGRVIDALPGLYGPQAFLRGLQQAEAVISRRNQDGAVLSDQQWQALLRDYHAKESQKILTAWQSDLQQLGLLAADAVHSPSMAVPVQLASITPNAEDANRLSISKRAVETKVLAAVLPDVTILTTKTDDSVWTRLAQLHRADALLDPASIALIQSQNPTAGRAMPLAGTKAMIETPLLRMVSKLQNTIAIDTIRNEYTFHRQIHDWFASGEVPLTIDVNELNERVYAQLFLTPSSDPWLGLLPGDTYTALDQDGVSKN